MPPQVRVAVKTRRVTGGGPGIPSIIKAVKSNTHEAAYNFARGTEASAKRRAHVITGHMKGSIHRVKIVPGYHKVIVGAYYGVYEEYGTRHRPPHPFLRPAVIENKAKFMAAMKQVFHA